MHAIRAGVSLDTVHRPLHWTKVMEDSRSEEANLFIRTADNFLDSDCLSVLKLPPLL